MATNTTASDSPTDDASPEALERTLAQWRTKLDELKVQGDLATMDAREAAKKQIEVTENVYLAVRNRLSEAAHDASGDLSSARKAVEQLLVDLRRAYDDAEAVIRRSKAN